MKADEFIIESEEVKILEKGNITEAKKGVKIINVARGPVVKEDDVIELLENEFVSALGTDVFEIEPFPIDSKLRNFPQNFYGSHNGSNTIEAVDNTSHIAINQIAKFLKIID